jgi:hypothetical protein
MRVTSRYLSHLMLGNSLFEIIRVASVVAAIGAFQDIYPETHNPLAPSPFALSLSKPVLSGDEGGVSQVRSCFDKLSTNGLITDVIL